MLKARLTIYRRVADDDGVVWQRWRITEHSMAAVWLQALKVIPWGTVIDAAPGLAGRVLQSGPRTYWTAADGATAASSSRSGRSARFAHAASAHWKPAAQATERQQAAAELLDAGRAERPAG
jgi:hypothetical protein